jgi:hypothetical protein
MSLLILVVSLDMSLLIPGNPGIPDLQSHLMVSLDMSLLIPGFLDMSLLIPGFPGHELAHSWCFALFQL